MKNPRKIDLIVVHCSATRVNQDFPVEALEACHKARGFRSIGYHYYITKDGIVYPCRPETEVGAHARHYNAHSIGICYEGGLDVSIRSTPYCISQNNIVTLHGGIIFLILRQEYEVYPSISTS